MMRVHHFTPVAAIGASALTVVGAVAIMIVQGSPESDAIAGTDMSTGVTVTEGPGAEASTESVTRAVPSITGGAPLPKEEQGLPGR